MRKCFYKHIAIANYNLMTVLLEPWGSKLLTDKIEPFSILFFVKKMSLNKEQIRQRRQ